MTNRQLFNAEKQDLAIFQAKATHLDECYYQIVKRYVVNTGY